MPLTFDDWCDRVDHIFRTKYDWPRSFTSDCGRTCFRQSFDRGETPEDEVAIQIDAAICLQ